MKMYAETLNWAVQALTCLFLAFLIFIFIAGAIAKKTT